MERFATARLAAARAAAWALLVAGWVGLGSLGFAASPGVAGGFATVAAWLLVLGAAASVSTRRVLPSGLRRIVLPATAAATAGALWAVARGQGDAALALAVLGWGALTALASGVVRELRRARLDAPAPPIGPATLGALVAAAVLGDLAEPAALALRLALFVAAVAGGLVALQLGAPARTHGSGCRAGLFDCSLPAWPAGAWHDTAQWPTLLAGLVMLPMMATLPLMAAWCRSDGFPAQALVLLHVGAMFAPVWLVRRTIGVWPSTRLAGTCVALLVAGAACVLIAPRPFDAAGLALAHGTAWGLAWGGQLWAPARRASVGASPLRAAAGYALLTLGFGLGVDRLGADGVAFVHVLLAALALAAGVHAWMVGVPVQAMQAEAEPLPHPNAVDAEGAARDACRTSRHGVGT